MEKRTYKITPITGVHIGTGEELSPLDYKIVIDDIGSKQVYRKFSGDKILQRLTETGNEKAMEDFKNASENMAGLIKFFRDNCANEDVDYSCEVTGGLHLDTGRVLPMYYTYNTEGKPNPVIPGSSIKGAIRTALLNSYLNDLSKEEVYQSMLNSFKEVKNSSNKSKNKFDKFEERMQTKLLDFKDKDEKKPKDAKKDPLRAISISDCSFEAEGAQLIGGLDLVPFRQKGSLKPKEDSRIQAEVLRGKLLDGNAVSEICISINNELQKTPFPPEKNFHQKKPFQQKPLFPPKTEEYIMKKITFDDIRNRCNYFFMREFLEEYKKFYKEINDETGKLIVELKKKLEEAVNSKDSFIIRVGRWSQIEFVTFEKKFRQPLINKGRQGSKRRLFDYYGKYAPLGWCILTVKE
jgi:CRISPR-associated protein Csm5